MLPRPSDGSQRSHTEKIRIRMRPNENTGMAWRASAIHMIALRSLALVDSRITRPMLNASAIPSTKDVNASSSVAGTRSRTRSSADVRCRSETPKSPVTALARNFRYWTTSG